MAGPCSVESREQLIETADAVAAAGATILRGGAFKPRTSPYASRASASRRSATSPRRATGPACRSITEVMEPNQVDIVAEYADILQIGTRNMQNFSLLKAVGRVARPVMLKRGFGATIEELLMAAEYIVAAGNPNVILCERGIRTFETYTRNTLDLAAVPVLHQLTHLPVIVDPSHATGKRWLVAAARARRRGGRRRRRDGRGPPGPGLRPCPTPSSSSTSRRSRALMRELVPVHEQVRGHARRDVARGAADVAATGTATGCRGIERRVDAVPSQRRGPTRAPASTASCACPATSRSATGR